MLWLRDTSMIRIRFDLLQNGRHGPHHRQRPHQRVLWVLELKICCPLLAACVQLQTHKFPFPFDTWQPIKLVKKYSNKGQQPLAGQRLGLVTGGLRLETRDWHCNWDRDWDENWIWQLQVRRAELSRAAKGEKENRNTRTVSKMVKSASQSLEAAHIKNAGSLFSVCFERRMISDFFSFWVLCILFRFAFGFFFWFWVRFCCEIKENGGIKLSVGHGIRFYGVHPELIIQIPLIRH